MRLRRRERGIVIFVVSVLVIGIAFIMWWISPSY